MMSVWPVFMSVTPARDKPALNFLHFGDDGQRLTPTLSRERGAFELSQLMGTKFSLVLNSRSVKRQPADRKSRLPFKTHETG
jgi:hypothetical protein